MRTHVVQRMAGATVACLTLLGSVSLLSADVEDRFTDWFTPVNIDTDCETNEPINTAVGEQAAFISKDGLNLYFTSNRSGGLGGTDIWVSQRRSVEEEWGTPMNLGPSVNSGFDEFAPSLTIDGHTLFFQSDRPGGKGGFDIYVARRCKEKDNCHWKMATAVRGDVNTDAQEEHPVYFEDETTGVVSLYYTYRRDVPGANDDIYVSTVLPDGSFSAGVPVAELNTANFFERQPAVRRDGLEMYLVSNRPGTVGGLDLWVSTRASTAEQWSTPVNLGPTVNSTARDARPALSFDGTELYFQSDRPGGCGALDLYVTTRTKANEE